MAFTCLIYTHYDPNSGKREFVKWGGLFNVEIDLHAPFRFHFDDNDLTPKHHSCTFSTLAAYERYNIYIVYIYRENPVIKKI